MMALAALGAGGGCGDNLVPEAPGDGGTATATLAVLTPPGDSLGLTFSERTALRVRYSDSDGQPIAGAEVAFSLVSAPNESAGGATLAAPTAITGTDGIAAVDVIAGAERANFRVEAQAAMAANAIFFVAVAEGGFTTLVATPAHAGARPEEVFEGIELRLFRADTISCANVDIDALPAADYPPRTVAAFSEAATFVNVPATEGATLVAWGVAGESAIASGCVDIAGQAVRAGRQVNLLITVADRALALAPTAVISTLDLDPIAAAVAAAGDDDAWAILGCPVGPGQLALDCALDAAASDGEVDCRATGSGPLLDAIAGHRGASDENGCRPLTTTAGDPSIDALLAGAIATGGTFPTGDDLAALLAVRRDLLSSVVIESRLTPITPSVASHTLTTLRPGAAGDVAIDVGASSRPVISAQVPITITAANVVAGEHGFSLRYGDAAATAFDSRALGPAGLSGQAASLGTALVAAAEDPDSARSGCAAISAVACEAAGQGLTCLEAACATGAGVLDGELAAWLGDLSGGGLDLSWSGAAPITDSDFDLIIDPIGGPGRPAGAWSARMTLKDQGEVVLSGAFHTAAIPGAVSGWAARR